MDESKFEEINIFTNIYVASYFGAMHQQKECILNGKMFEHVTQAKYTFKACDFFVLLPNEKNKMYHSEMYSDDCFNGELKWNHKFFKKIRKNLNNGDQKSKSFYFSLSKHKSGQNDEEFLGIQSDSQKFILQMHMKMENKEIVVFRLVLNPYLVEKPESFFFDKLIELEKEENSKMESLKKKIETSENEKQRYTDEAMAHEKAFETEKRDYIYKFFLLVEEKNKKIKELTTEQK